MRAPPAERREFGQQVNLVAVEVVVGHGSDHKREAGTAERSNVNGGLS